MVSAPNVPPVTVMSPAAKPVGAALKVKLMLAVSPALRAVLSLVISSVIGAPCMVRATLLLVSAPSAFALPPRSKKALLPTLTLPAPVKFWVGVNTPV